jgi:hypothetical protein
MATRKFYIVTAAVVAALAFCILPLEKLQPVEAEPSTIVRTTAEAAETTTGMTAPTIEPDEVELIARTIWGEARGVESKTEQAAVAWCVFNRVDESGKSIEEVVTAPHQFQGYWTEGNVPSEFYELAVDVLTRWRLEKAGVEDVGRVLPADYLFFIGHGGRNYFSKEWQAPDFWDWTLKSPY